MPFNFHDGKKVQKKHTVLLFAPMILLFIGYLILCVLGDPGRILPRTTVNGVKVGGMTQEEAVRVLKEDASARFEDARVLVSAGEEPCTYTVEIEDTLDYDCEALAVELLERSQSGFLTRGFSVIRAFLTGYDREAVPHVKDMEALCRNMESSGLLDTDTMTPTSYCQEDGQLVFTKGTTGKAVDKEQLAEEICLAVASKDLEQVIRCPMRDAVPEPVDLKQIYQEIFREPVNASLDPENGYGIVDSVTGVSFDAESAKKALNAAEEGSTVMVSLIYTEPEITTQDMQEHLFQDRLASYTTRVTGTSGRRKNISLAAESCNGIILLSGDVFSFNHTVGEQTAETGFEKANAILDGKIIQAYGGGICQVSSTIFAAALYAGLEIPERWNHYYVCRYIDAGLDAAVAWDALDLQIANDMEYPVRLEVDYRDGYLTATLWGTRTRDTIVEVETKTVSTSEDSLEVQTYRNHYNSDKSQVYIEKAAYSVYANGTTD